MESPHLIDYYTVNLKFIFVRYGSGQGINNTHGPKIKRTKIHRNL